MSHFTQRVRPISPDRRRGVAAPAVAERLSLAVFLLAVFLLQLRIAFHLNALEAFAQYNLFFDADSIQYVAAVANGWSFNREIHPGFALFFNAPIRAVDALASALGIISAGAIRNAFAIVLSPLCGLIGAVFLWLACVRAGVSGFTRIGAVVLLQGSFSQVVFAVIPESYAASGMLYCVLLWAAAHAAARRADLDRTVVRAGWLLLCVVMTGVTVSNGIVCVGVWLALRAWATPWRRWLLEALSGACVVAVSMAALRIVDRWVYALPSGKMADSVEEISNHALDPHSLPQSLSGRIVDLPAHALASIVAPSVERIEEPPTATNHNRYPFRFSVIESAVTEPRLLVSWVLVICGLVAGFPRLAASSLARATAVIFTFNIILHSVWGREVFLYSQHWLAFLVFAIAAGIDRARRIGGPLVLALGLFVALYSAWCFPAIVAALHGEPLPSPTATRATGVEPATPPFRRPFDPATTDIARG